MPQYARIFLDPSEEFYHSGMDLVESAVYRLEDSFCPVQSVNS